ncbi:hypothetical protein F0562_032670 [Nyssa sinensis]|uniref:Retrovirus-related Pol polyprotein from transposon TNT 1-94-like beta-barrel domain-containing protein n=1 Tax=Nyssa sinensis TaxID=561372 RepID=A0A5J5AQB5_9ASTE|nr:hypothetical protein F0562_032670 [Nyssa sinensis]
MRKKKKNKKNFAASGDAIVNSNKNKTEGKAQQQEVEDQVANQEVEDQLFVTTCFASSSSSESWLINSGYTNHMTYDKELFKELVSTTITKVRIGNGDHIAVKGKGDVQSQNAKQELLSRSNGRETGCLPHLRKHNTGLAQEAWPFSSHRCAVHAKEAICAGFTTSRRAPTELLNMLVWQENQATIS